MEVPHMRHTKSRTGSRSFTLIELVPLPQLLNLTARKPGDYSISSGGDRPTESLSLNGTTPARRGS
jgi:hypothetical protein